MKSYATFDSWTKQSTIDRNEGIRRMVGLQKNGHILVESQAKPFSSELSSYDLESQQVKDLGICGVQHLFLGVDNCVESVENLVLLDKPNDAVSKRRVHKQRKRKCR